MMQVLLSGLVRPIANIVHIGAGTGEDLPVYLDAKPKAVLLVEANPGIAEQLQARAAGKPGVRVVEAAVSANGEKRVFRHTNFPDLDSFRASTGLSELFPGLRVLSQDPVVPANPVELLKGLELSGEGSNLLVLETPGESLGILQALETANLLMCFDAIRLREGQAQLYDAAATVGEIRDYLTGRGFSAQLESAPEDPERPYLNARLDRTVLALRQEVKSLREELEKARGQGNEQTRQVEDLTAARDAAQKAAETQTARSTALVAERDKAVQEASQARQDLSVALRMQALHQSDLADLQGRYAALLAEKQASDALLEKVGASLVHAARFLDQPGAPAAAKTPPARPARSRKSASARSKTGGGANE